MDERDEMQGEGDREADRHYREKTREFVESGKVAEAATEAKAAYERNRTELEATELAARADAEARIIEGAMTERPDHDMLADRISELATLRDTLKVRIHLAQQEMQDLFAQMEDRWAALAQKTNAVKEASVDSVHDVGAATRLLIDEIHESYSRLKSILTSSTPTS